MKFSAPLWSRISELFDEGSARSGEARVAWLAALDAGDPACADFVREMLDASDATVVGASHDPFAEPLDAVRLAALSEAAQGSELTPGQQLGPYRLVDLLGEGGMATVWRADQTSGVLRQVALKIPRLGLEEGRAAARRFEQERDFLAALEHPHIARLYDAGVSTQGQSYLAMELIDGAPITAFCDDARSSLRERLELFGQVLEAVEHAHARLVIHRDLKAGNILVTPQGRVKLLDFGIAGLLDDAAESRVLTPDSASPEQLAGEPLGAASDVYSLGVVLYELLTGRPPYRLDRQAPDLTADLARQTTPRPSRAGFEVADALARQTTPARLRRALAGELDAIVCKALARDASARYATVGELSRDLRRHAALRPVQAMPSTWRYRSGRFVRRRRWALLSGSAVCLALGAGLAAALWQAHEARLQAARAREVQAFVKQIFRASEPEQAQGRDLGARELLTRGGARLEARLGGQPEVLVDLQAEIGEILFDLGANVEARPYLEKAIAGYERLGRGAEDDAMRASIRLSQLLINETQWEPARALSRQVLARSKGRSNGRWALQAQSNLAFIEAQQGDAATAVRILEQSLAEQRRAGAPVDEGRFAMEVDLGHSYMSLEKYAKARDAYTQALNDLPALPGFKLTDQLVCRLNIGFARLLLDDNQGALKDMPALVADLERHLGPRAGHAVNARSLHAQLLAAVGRYDEAVALQRANLVEAGQRQTVDGDAHAFQQGVMAVVLRQAARFDEGLAPASAALAAFDAKQPAPNWRAERLRARVGDLQRGAGQTEAGIETTRRAEARARTLAGHASSERYAEILQSLALAEHADGRDAVAAQWAQQSLRIVESAAGPGEPKTLRGAVLEAWLQAITVRATPASMARFDAAAGAYAGIGPAPAARAELELMRADLEALSGADGAASTRRLAAARAWREATGRDWPGRLVLLH